MLELLWKKPCAHDKIAPNINCGYCPDCGEFVENKWFISKCKCCGLKQKTLILNGKIIAEAKFCKNCGNNSFNVEELEGVDIVSINYAVLKTD